MSEDIHNNRSPLELVLELALDGVVAINQENRIIEWNKQAEKIFGWQKSEVMGKVMSDIIVPQEFRGAHQDGLQHFLSTGYGKILTNRIEVSAIRRDGQLVPVELTVVPAKIEGQYRFYSFVRDLTEKREKEAQLIYNSKMSSLGEMAGGMAHELNNPLAIIIGKIELVVMDLEENNTINKEVLLKDLKGLIDTSNRMAKIITGLRSFSRQSASDDPYDTTTTTKMIENTLSFCTSRIKNLGIDLRLDIENDLVVKCRSIQISQVLLNLLNNSCDAISSSGNKWISIHASESRGGISIKVYDSGPGISKNVLNKIMEPFFTTKAPGKGTGLGLSISKGLIEGHGGTLQLLPEEAHTCFEIWIPSGA